MTYQALRYFLGPAYRVMWAILVLHGLLNAASAQGSFYTFTSGPTGDGFNWPASPTGLLPDEYYVTPDGVEFDNYIGNNLFFDDNYLVAANSPDIDGDAMWGDPHSGTVDIYLSGLGAQSVSFSFAQSVGGAPSLTNDYLDIYVEDSEGRATQFTSTLTNTFTGLGGFDGYSGVVQFDTSFLIDDYGSVDGGPLVDIDYFYIDLYSLDNTSKPAEFAIDNFSLDAFQGSLDPENSDLSLGTSGISTNRLRSTTTGSSFFSFDFVEVVNFGTGGTTYSMALDPWSDPEFVIDAPTTNRFIGGDQSIEDGSGSIALIDTGSLSGDYHASATLTNDLNPFDSDDQVTYRMRILDRPELSDDSGTKQVHADPTVFITNAAAGPHAGALRASVEVTARTLSGDGFSIIGFKVGDLVDPAETEEATVNFDRYGRLNGNYAGTLTVALEMVDTEFSFLNSAEPVPNKNWNLTYELTTISSDSAALTAGEPLAKKVGVNNPATAATLLDGDSAASQIVSLQVVANPGLNADLATDAVDLEFSSGNVDPYVLQFTYTDGNVPADFAESQLQLLWFDSDANQWEAAIDGNSTSSSTFFAGSYADYLAGPGGGTFDVSDLGAFGVDAVNNHAWAVLDHASIFALGVLTAGLPGDFDLDGDVDGRDFLVWQRGGSPNPLSAGDLILWQSQYGTPLTAASSAVPEPTTIGLCFGLLTGICLRGDRRRIVKSAKKC